MHAKVPYSTLKSSLPYVFFPYKIQTVAAGHGPRSLACGAHWADERRRTGRAGPDADGKEESTFARLANRTETRGPRRRTPSDHQQQSQKSPSLGLSLYKRRSRGPFREQRKQKKSESLPRRGNCLRCGGGGAPSDPAQPLARQPPRKNSTSFCLRFSVRRPSI